MRKLRTFAGAPLPLPLQKVAEARLGATRRMSRQAARCIRQKFADAAEVFAGLQGFDLPEGGFFLWLPVEDGEAAALKLWRETGVRVLPGAYLSREVDGDNPGKGYIRVALVAPTGRNAARADPAARLPLCVRTDRAWLPIRRRQRDPLLDQNMQAMLERRGQGTAGAGSRRAGAGLQR